MDMETEKMAAPARVPQPPSVSGSSNNNLAMVVDKRPSHRPGGCVGIFFQLFDWNRRLASKKFFSRKLLPQVRAAKKISKKFASDERMPAAKLLLIADENRGGFPTTKKADVDVSTRPPAGNAERGSSMCTPGLVARLMGLESMPAAVRHDKPRKAVDGASTSSDGGCYFDSSDTSGSSRHYQELGLESVSSVHTKLERRPQKLQKTGFFDRRPMIATRVGSEALLFNKSLLGRSRKRMHHKLASPVKSTRLPGRKSSARLMDAATRILEPGLHARNRARCALTYMAPLQANVEGVDASPLLQRHIEPLNAPLVSPCKNCGTLVQVPDKMLKADEPSTADYGSSSTSSDFSNTSSHDDGFVGIVPKAPVNLKDESKTPSLAIQAKANVQSRSHGSMERKSHSQNELLEQSKPRQGAAASRSAVKQNNMTPNETPLVRGKVTPQPKSRHRQIERREPCSMSGSKDFVALNRNLNSCSRMRTTIKTMDSRRMEMEGSAWDGKSLVRKRRSITNINQIETNAAANSTFSKQRPATNEVHNGKETRLTGDRPVHGSSVKGLPQKLRAGDCNSGIKNGRIVSFRFNAPMGNATMPSGSVSEKRKAGHICEGTSQSGTLTYDSPTGKVSYGKVPDKKVDALSALLEQKINELTSLNRDDWSSGDDVRSRSTAAILEELIAALTAARPIPQKKEHDSPVDLGIKDESCYDSAYAPSFTDSHGPNLNIVKKSQVEEKSGVSNGMLHSTDYDQPSPVSILEASFSNDSCLSESFNSSSGHQTQAGFTEGSFDKSQSSELDADLSDSATSTNVMMTELGSMPLPLDNISIMIADPRGSGYSGSNPDYVWGVISNAELFFESTTLDGSNSKACSSIDIILLDTLETLLDAFWEGPNSDLHFSETAKERRRLLFDCIIEHLDFKYGCCCTTGFKSWMKLPLLTGDKLTRDICKQIRSWGDLAGKVLDEIVEKDMSCMNVKWTYFEAEAFEAGVDIENDLLQLLVEETVIDLIQC